MPIEPSPRDTPFAAVLTRPPGLISAFRLHADGMTEELRPPADLLDRREANLWLHFDLSDARTPATLRSIGELPPRALAFLLAIDDHQQLHAEGGYIFGVVADLVRDLTGATDEVGLLRFVLTEHMLVSVRRHPLTAVEATRLALRGGRKVASAAALLETVVEHVIDAADRYAAEMGRDLDRIEDQILLTEVKDERQTLGRVRRIAVRLHRQLGGLRTLFQRVERERDADQPALGLAAGRLSQRLDDLDHEIVALRDRAHLLQEEVSMKVAERTNNHLQVLAVVTTLFLPPTLLAGIFGMNLGGLPMGEDPGGFWWGVALIGASALVVFFILRMLGILFRR